MTPGAAGPGAAGPGAHGPGLALLVLAKAPRPGYSKTRLAPDFGAVGAARLAAAALADTLTVVSQVPAARRVLVLDGDLDGRWVPDLPLGFEVVPQTDGGHAARIAAALELADGPALLIGMDTPQVTPDLLQVDLSGDTSAWFGAAEDGGWWALGLREARRFARQVLAGVPMSTSDTGRLQRLRLVEAGLQIADLPPLRDVDLPADAHAVARQAPGTRFAQALAALDPPAEQPSVAAGATGYGIR